MSKPLKILSLIFLLFVFSCGTSFAGPKQVCFNKNTCVRVEIASDQVQRQQGLMFREGLAEDEGMLFVFEEEGIHAFWMKNMRFPLDLIWIDAKKKVVEIYPNALPCQGPCEVLTPHHASQFAIEVPAGFAEKNKVKVGDTLEF